MTNRKFNKGTNLLQDELFLWLDKPKKLPGHFYIGPTCLSDHGKGGETVYYRETRKCIVCHEQDERDEMQRLSLRRPLKALHAWEERQYREEFDPLFD